jgi:hypothetical protein
MQGKRYRLGLIPHLALFTADAQGLSHEAVTETRKAEYDD